MGGRHREQVRRPRLKATALHEAAHAVVAEMFGGRVESVAIDRPVPIVGVTQWLQKKYRGKVDPIQTACVALAGYAVECLTSRHHEAMSTACKDFESVCKLGVRPSGRSMELVLFLVRRLVRANLPIIRRVAAELLRRGSLSRRQFLRVARG